RCTFPRGRCATISPPQSGKPAPRTGWRPLGWPNATAGCRAAGKALGGFRPGVLAGIGERVEEPHHDSAFRLVQARGDPEPAGMLVADRRLRSLAGTFGDAEREGTPIVGVGAALDMPPALQPVEQFRRRGAGDSQVLGDVSGGDHLALVGT